MKWLDTRDEEITKGMDMFKLLGGGTDDANGSNFEIGVSGIGGLQAQVPIVQAWANSMNQAALAEMDVNEAMASFENYTKTMAPIVSGLTKGLGTLASAFVNIGASMAISAAIGLVINGLKKLRDAHQDAIDAGKDSQKNIHDTYENYEKMAESTDKLTKRYNELRKGVEYTEGKGFSNISLSTEEFEEFLDVNEQIAEMFPSLADGISASGQLFVDLGTNVEEATQKMQSMLEAEKQITELNAAKELPSMMKGLVEGNKDVKKEIKQQEKELDTLGKDGVIYNPYTGELQIPQQVYEDNIDYIRERIQSLIKDNNVVQDHHGFDQRYIGEAPYMISSFYGDEANMQAFVASLTQDNGLVNLLNNQAKGQIQEIESEIATLNNKQQLEYEKLIPQIVQAFQADPVFKGLPEAIQDGFASSLYNIDYESLSESDQLDFGGYVNRAIINPISTALGNSENKEQLQQDLEKLFTNSFGDMKAANVPDFIDDVLEQLFPEDRKSQLNFAELLGLGTNKPDKLAGRDFTYAIDEQRRNLLAAINKNQSVAKEKWDTQDIWDLEADEIDEINKRIANKTFDFVPTAENGFEDLRAYLKDTMADIEPELEGKFTDIFQDKEFTESAEGYEKTLSSISSALQKYRDEGKLTAEESKDLMRDLQMGDNINEETLSAKGLETLSKYISGIRKEMSDMSPEEAQKAQNYINTIAESYIDAFTQVKDKDVGKLIAESLGIDEAKNTLERQSILTRSNNVVEKFKEQFKEQMGTDANNQILATMAIEGDFANFDGDMQSLIDRYKELNVLVKFDYDEARLNALQELNDATKDKQQAMRDEKESMGEYLSSEDFTQTIETDQNELDIAAEREGKALRNMLDAMEEYRSKKAKLEEQGAKSGLTQSDVDEAEKTYLAAQKEYESAQTGRLQAKTTLNKDQQQARQADLDAIERDLQKNQQEKEKLDAEIEAKKQIGFEEEQSDLYNQNQNLLERNALLRSEIDQLESSTQQDKDSEIAKRQTEIKQNNNVIQGNWRKIQSLDALKEVNDEITNLEKESGNITSTIDNVSDIATRPDLIESRISNAGALLKDYYQELDYYQGEMERYESLFPDTFEQNTQWQNANNEVDNLTQKISDLNELNRKAKSDSVLATYADDLQNIKNQEANLETIGTMISDVQKEVDLAEKSGQDPGGALSRLETLQGIAADYAHSMEQSQERISNAFKTVDQDLYKEYDENSKKSKQQAEGYEKDLWDTQVKIGTNTYNYDQQIKRLEGARKQLEQAQEGKVLDAEDYEDQMDLSSAFIKAYKNQFNENALKIANKGINSEIKQVLKEQNEEIADSIATEESKYKQADVNRREDTVNQIQRELSNLQTAEEEYNRIIGDTSIVTSKNIFGEKDANLKEQLGFANALKLGYQYLKDSVPEDDENYQKYVDGLADAEAQINSLNQEIKDNSTDEFNNKLQTQSDQYDELTRAAKGYQDVIDNVHHTATEQDYSNLIKNGNQQIVNLKQQIQAWKDYQTTVDEGSPDWLSAQSNIDNLGSSIVTMTQNISNWKSAIEDLPLDKINRALELNQANADLENSKIAAKEARKEDTVSEDYAESVDLAEENFELSKDALREQEHITRNARKSAQIQETLGKELISEEELNQAEIDLKNAESNVEKSATNLHEKLTEEQTADLNPILTEYSNLQTAYDNISKKISNDMANTKLEVGNTEDYNELLSTSEQMVQNLRAQSSEWEKIAAARRDNAEYSPQEVKDAEQEANRLKALADETEARQEDIKANQIISNYSDALTQAQQTERDLQEVARNITETQNEITNADAGVDVSKQRTALAGYYETEKGYYEQLSNMYNTIADDLEASGLYQQADKFRSQADTQSGNLQNVIRSENENLLAQVGVNEELLQSLTELDQRKEKLENDQKSITESGGFLTENDLRESKKLAEDYKDLYEDITKDLDGKLNDTNLDLTQAAKNQINSLKTNYEGLADEQERSMNTLDKQITYMVDFQPTEGSIAQLEETQRTLQTSFENAAASQKADIIQQQLDNAIDLKAAYTAGGQYWDSIRQGIVDEYGDKPTTYLREDYKEAASHMDDFTQKLHDVSAAEQEIKKNQILEGDKGILQNIDKANEKLAKAEENIGIWQDKVSEDIASGKDPAKSLENVAKYQEEARKAAADAAEGYRQVRDDMFSNQIDGFKDYETSMNEMIGKERGFVKDWTDTQLQMASNSYDFDEQVEILHGAKENLENDYAYKVKDSDYYKSMYDLAAAEEQAITDQIKENVNKGREAAMQGLTTVSQAMIKITNFVQTEKPLEKIWNNMFVRVLKLEYNNLNQNYLKQKPVDSH